MWIFDWERPVSLLDTAVAEGVQVCIREVLAEGFTRETWKTECRKRGLRYILSIPLDDVTLKEEAADPFCFGWDQPDEPDDASPTTVPIPVLLANYNRLMAVKRPDQHVMLNFDAWPEEAWGPFDYLAASKCATLLMCDYYVRMRYGPNAVIGDIEGPKLDRFKGYCRDGQLFGFFIETCNQIGTTGTNPYFPLAAGPTPDDEDAYFVLAAKKKCECVSLFQHVVGPIPGGWIAFNGTTPENAARITANTKKYSTPLPGLAGLHPPVQSGGSDPLPAPVPQPVDPLAGAVITLNISVGGRNYVYSVK